MFARIAVLCAMMSVAWTFNNQLDHGLTYQCPTKDFLYKIYSEHDNSAEDRRFRLECKDLPVTTRKHPVCSWTGWLNNFDRPFAFSCPGGQYVAGMSSYHDNRPEDRRFKLYCCELTDYHMMDCVHSSFLNGYDRSFDFTAPSGMVTRGMTSIHDNEPEDRIFDFESCKLVYFPGYK